MKRKILAFLGVASPALVFAEGNTALTSAVTQLQGAATEAVTAITTPVTTVLVAVFGIVAIFAAFRWIRRALGR